MKDNLNDMRAGRVEIDGIDGTFAALIAPDDWNGWACPYFTKEEALRFVEEFNKASMMGQQDAHYDAAEDAFVFESEGQKDAFGAVMVNGTPMYAIGAWCWCWFEVSVDSVEPAAKTVAEAAALAQEAFWAKVVELYPEAQSGDFPPDAAAFFDNACEQAIKLWLQYNLPEPTQSKVAAVLKALETGHQLSGTWAHPGFIMVHLPNSTDYVTAGVEDGVWNAQLVTKDGALITGADVDPVSVASSADDVANMIAEAVKAWHLTQRPLPPDAAEQVAAAFDRLLREQLEDNYAAAIERNRKEADPSICHTHDFCDANMVMAEAIKQATGHDALTQREEICRLWNDAWSFWKRQKQAHIWP